MVKAEVEICYFFAIKQSIKRIIAGKPPISENSSGSLVRNGLVIFDHGFTYKVHFNSTILIFCLQSYDP